MRTFLYKLTLKKRMWVSFVLLIAFSIGTMGGLSYYISARVIEKNTFQLSQDNLNTSARVLDEKVKQILVSVLNIMISQPFIQMAKDAYVGKADSYYAHMTAMNTSFTQAKLAEPAIESIFIATPIGEFYSASYYRNQAFSFYDSDMFTKVKDSKEPLWVKGHEDLIFQGKDRVISLVMQSINEAPNMYFVVNLNEKSIQGMLSDRLKEPADQHIYLINDAAESVLMNQPRLPDSYDKNFLDAHIGSSKQGHFEVKLKGHNDLVNYARAQFNPDWLLLSVQSRSELLKELNWIQWATILTMLVCIIMAVFVSNLLSAILLKPLYYLQTLMSKVGRNDLSVRYSSPFQDEVSQVGHKFNSMLMEITELIDEVKKAEQDKRKSEAKALQAQISPHFLYNTLNTIIWKMEMGELDSSKVMVIALSQLFQLGLNNGEEMTSVEKEISHVRQYLTIQQLCYEELFEFEIIVQDEVLLQCPILKVVLQPVVENSLLHGFEHMESGGVIRIELSLRAGKLHILIEDNGSGFDADKVYTSLRIPTSGRKGYALRNVYNRLQLYYGGEAEMVLSSTPFESTQVVITIPIKEALEE
ncbi:sensor histidine kinase [Paenibacillus roseipurpureus]|uniref:Sensor histidine kinase n=1 Tax=Paenibacillus roseopurpureus TaxID=2918901 RepID=A0AA96LSN0_9BACL|nr:sensor histidine kinase [Paenibacillus sp. MBLB1832]WNR45339.1 sensor histidine kinase [Paenibacillus sp. MBLB1832]